MGRIAESLVEYAQPLIDETDGSHEDVQKAFSVAQMCWNLALLPEKDREDSLAEVRSAFRMSDAAFAEFCEEVVEPMIKRHHEMFPNMHKLASERTAPRTRTEKYPGTGRNERCPCGSGKKYKRCCGG